MKPYLFTYSAARSQEGVHAILNATAAIHNWVAPFPYSAILVSNLDNRELSAILRRQLNGAWFVLTKIDNHSIDGWLPGDFWQFVNNPAEASLAGLLPHQPMPARGGDGDRPKGLVGSAIERVKGLAWGGGHIPQTWMVLPSAVSSRRNTRSSHDLPSVRSNTTRWPRSAPQRSM